MNIFEELEKIFVEYKTTWKWLKNKGISTAEELGDCYFSNQGSPKGAKHFEEAIFKELSSAKKDLLKEFCNMDCSENSPQDMCNSCTKINEIMGG